jgi:hypothetical protein
MLKRSQLISTLIELVGVAAVVAGVALLCVPAAFIVGGVAVAAIGVALGREASA